MKYALILHNVQILLKLITFLNKTVLKISNGWGRCLMVTGYFYWQRHQGEITNPWKAALEHAWHQWECTS